MSLAEHLKTTIRDWLIYHQKHIVFKQCRWRGVLALKNPLDSWIYQEIMHETRPDIVVEIGAYCGGSTLYLANLLDLQGHGQVLSLEIDRSKYQAPEHPRITKLDGDCSDPPMVKRVHGLCSGKKVMIIHDGDHKQVGRDLELYWDLVQVGQYLIVEDTLVDVLGVSVFPAYGAGGPGKGVAEFMARHPGKFVVDVNREKYLITYNPGGFLKRVV
jgi:cephalosporin hydroxylase